MKAIRFTMASIAVGALAFAAFARMNDNSTTTETLGEAPAFTGKTASGKNVSLRDFSGKFVVLEWWNFDCPFVVRHYNAGNMQATQKRVRDMGGVWLTICSSAPGLQGHVTAEQATRMHKEKNFHANEIILDPEGTIGKAFGAQTTPHMIIINPRGEIIYNGAIDDNQRNHEGATNYVLKALEEAMAGKPVSTPRTRPYGCSVKYPS